MGYAVLHLSHFKSDPAFQDWLPVRGSNKMKNKQQFRQEILNQNTNPTDKKGNKGDSIQRAPTDFDYITSNSEQKFCICQSFCHLFSFFLFCFVFKK